jgi:hypothetical protein
LARVPERFSWIHAFDALDDVNSHLPPSSASVIRSGREKQNVATVAARGG